MRRAAHGVPIDEASARGSRGARLIRNPRSGEQPGGLRRRRRRRYGGGRHRCCLRGSAERTEHGSFVLPIVFQGASIGGDTTVSVLHNWTRANSTSAPRKDRSRGCCAAVGIESRERKAASNQVAARKGISRVQEQLRRKHRSADAGSVLHNAWYKSSNSE